MDDARLEIYFQTISLTWNHGSYLSISTVFPLFRLLDRTNKFRTTQSSRFQRDGFIDIVDKYLGSSFR